MLRGLNIRRFFSRLCGACGLYKCFESLRAVDGKICHNLPVYVHIGLGKTTDQLAVGRSVQPSSCIDSGDPKRAKCPLLPATITVGRNTSSIDSIRSGTNLCSPPSPETLGQLQNLFSSSARGDVIGSSWHLVSSLSRWPTYVSRGPSLHLRLCRIYACGVSVWMIS